MDIEAIKTLGIPAATLMIGFVGGILAEPWKKQLVYRYERHRLRRALYVELSTNLENTIMYRLIVGPSPEKADEIPPLRDWLRKEIYNQALATQPVLFQEIREAKAISQYYFGISFTAEQSSDKQLEIFRNTTEMMMGLCERWRTVTSAGC